ncbi:Uu.00g077840.m01.CDS01 [Anthostomella pinea]|uniref:Uu.00g077840.m01.CDS01 n=1 Tax=Anthostomella pinea TaxID=933095 RepID=A0AAI8VKK4_9PEZI|nr:Uu.00g077840.m01.CDS01 [Anthostomella pinea]
MLRAVSGRQIFYPTVADIRSATEAAQHAASNIGCYTRPWNKAPIGIKRLFHHYRSKDAGCPFHQELILLFNPRDRTAPHYVYLGSANLSQSAKGALEQDKKRNEATCDVKLVKLTNFECGVVVPGSIVNDLLEPGIKTWQDGIVPHVQSAEQYHLQEDRPWNDPRWVIGYGEEEG